MNQTASSLRRALLLLVAALLPMLFVAGCSSAPKEYDSVGQLVSAFTAAGGNCADPADVPESFIGDGAHAQLCTPGVNMLIVFDTAEARNAYLASVIDGEKQDVVAGERWVAVGDKLASRANSLGGEVKVEQK